MEKATRQKLALLFFLLGLQPLLAQTQIDLPATLNIWMWALICLFTGFVLGQFKWWLAFPTLLGASAFFGNIFLEISEATAHQIATPQSYKFQVYMGYGLVVMANIAGIYLGLRKPPDAGHSRG